MHGIKGTEDKESRNGARDINTGERKEMVCVCVCLSVLLTRAMIVKRTSSGSSAINLSLMTTQASCKMCGVGVCQGEDGGRGCCLGPFFLFLCGGVRVLAYFEEGGVCGGAM